MMIPRKIADLPDGPRPMKRRTKPLSMMIDGERPIRKPSLPKVDSERLVRKPTKKREG